MINRARRWVLRRREAWPALGRALALVAVYGLFAAAVGLPVGVGFFLFVRHVLGQELRQVSLHLDEAMLLLQAAAAVLILLAALGLAALAMSYLDRQGTLAELGLRRTPKSGRLSARAAAAAAGLAGAVCGVGLALGAARLVSYHWATESWGDAALDLMGYTVVLGATAAAEEVVFRGYVRRTLTPAMGPTLAWVASAMLFGVFRAFAPFATPLAVVNAVLAGLILGGLVVLSGSLWPAIAAHLAWSLVEGFIFSLPVGGSPVEGLIGLQPTGGWLLGGNFGPEGGLLGLAVFLLAGAALRTVLQRKVA